MIDKAHDDELSRCWSAWLVAREVGDDKWVRYAINELRIAALQAQESLGVVDDAGTVLSATGLAGL